ncbi:FCD domain-containing protein, partial [Staphylococcus epidermidis]|uniref:FCD domain-containing protein n=1 Tax=Staphylococcus epidermidis TaxID=1282 RepID=UPI0011A882AD
DFHQVIIQPTNHHYLKLFSNHLKPLIQSLILISITQTIPNHPKHFHTIHKNHQLFIDAVDNHDPSILRKPFH